MSAPVLFAISYEIDGRSFAANIPAKSWEHANQIAESFGAKVLGSNVHEVTSINVDALMDFCSAISDESIRWKYNAREQLESFLSIGWKSHPSEF